MLIVTNLKAFKDYFHNVSLLDTLCELAPTENGNLHQISNLFSWKNQIYYHPVISSREF